MNLCTQTKKWPIDSTMNMFTAFISVADIGVLELGAGSNCIMSPSSGGVELGITVFTPHVIVNAVTSAVLEGDARKTLVLLIVSQKCIGAVQSHGIFIITFYK